MRDFCNFYLKAKQDDDDGDDDDDDDGDDDDDDDDDYDDYDDEGGRLTRMIIYSSNLCLVLAL